MAQGRLVEALKQIEDSISKIDHKHWPTLMQKLEVLQKTGMLEESLKLLKDMDEYFEDDDLKLNQVKEMKQSISKKIER